GAGPLRVGEGIQESESSSQFPGNSVTHRDRGPCARAAAGQEVIRNLLAPPLGVCVIWGQVGVAPVLRTPDNEDHHWARLHRPMKKGRLSQPFVQSTPHAVTAPASAPACAASSRRASPRGRRSWPSPPPPA